MPCVALISHNRVGHESVYRRLLSRGCHPNTDCCPLRLLPVASSRSNSSFPGPVAADPKILATEKFEGVWGTEGKGSIVVDYIEGFRGEFRQ